MAISNYTELVASIQSWMFDRTDLAPVCGDFITLAEADFNSAIRSRKQEVTTSISPIVGEYALPADFEMARQVTLGSNPPRPLKQVSKDYFDEHNAYAAGDTAVYYVTRGSIIVSPSSTDNITLTYFADLVPLSVSTPTNWLLTRYPNFYLYTACKHAATFIGDMERLQVVTALSDNAIKAIKRDNEASQLVRGASRVSGPTP